MAISIYSSFALNEASLISSRASVNLLRMDSSNVTNFDQIASV
jgi:hypothetical protein